MPLVLVKVHLQINNSVGLGNCPKLLLLIQKGYTRTCKILPQQENNNTPFYI